ncbi:MAG: hypothetical protein QE263_04980 [Vampirovibrionales bacterium]|nr:hypothetical protein [Vampirovibrionales bacterium]
MMNMAAMGAMRSGVSPQMGNPMTPGAGAIPAMAGMAPGNNLGVPQSAMGDNDVGVLLQQADSIVQSTKAMFGGQPLSLVASQLQMQKQASQQAGLGGAGGGMGGANSLGSMLNQLA